MATQTKKLDLRKPVGTDTVSVDLDISGNLQKIDDAGGEKKMVRRTSGLISIAGTNWRKIPTDASMDLIIKANAGDWVETGMSLLWASEAISGHLDVCSNPVAGTAVNAWGHKGPLVAANAGAMCWYSYGSVVQSCGGSVLRQVTADDLDAAGLLRLSPWARSSTAGTKNFYATPELPWEFWVKNNGQP